MQHYVIRFVSDLRQVDRWLCPGTPVSSTNKTDRHDITKILLKVALISINPNPTNLIVNTFVIYFRLQVFIILYCTIFNCVLQGVISLQSVCVHMDM
jgi:hypothetical protein